MELTAATCEAWGVKEYRRARRPADRRVIAGVCTGLAEHYGITVGWVQVGFVVATWLQGAGIIAYLLLWRFLPLQRPGDEAAPGMVAADRAGLRTGGRASAPGVGRALGLLAVAGGGLWFLAGVGLGPGDGLLGPLLLAVAGIALVWRQLDDAAMASWLSQTRGAGYWLRLALGLVFVLLAGAYLVGEAGAGSWRSVVDILVAVVVAGVGLGLILGGWVAGLWHDLGEERRQRIRSEERADMAAHLHDSVLQSLALLQRNAEDPATVATIARRQERELRTWLYGDANPPGSTVAGALRAEAEDVELTYRLPVEVVTVGDTPVTTETAALVQAAREALVNAAKHAKASRIDLFAEVNGVQLQVFIRDRGVGFDPRSVAGDRRGIRDSVIGRLDRVGGSATVRSVPGEGTEVALTLPVKEESSP